MQFMSKSEIKINDVIDLIKIHNLEDKVYDASTFAFDILMLHETLKEQKEIAQKAANDKLLKESLARHREYHARGKWNSISKGNWS